MGNCRFVAVAGMKGGVGKTTTCLEFASALTSLSRSVVVVEADVATPDLADVLRIDTRDRPTLADVLDGTATVFDAVTETESGIHLLPVGDPGAAAAKDVGDLSRLTRLLGHRYDVVFVDTPPAMGYGSVPALEAADECVVVTTPRLPAVHGAKRTVDTAARYGVAVRGIVLNCASTGRSPGEERISDFVGHPLLGAVPYDDRVVEACDRGEAVTLSAPESPAGRAFRRAAERFVETRPPDGS